MGAPVRAPPTSLVPARAHPALAPQPGVALLGLHYLASASTLLNDTDVVASNGCAGSLPGLLLSLLLAAAAAAAALRAESGSGEAGRRLVHASSD